MIKDYLDEKLHEECGVFGVYRRDADLDVVGTTYYAPVRAAAPRPGELRHGGERRRRVLQTARAGPCERRVYQGRAGDDAPGQYVHRPLPLCHHGGARPLQCAALCDPPHQGTDGAGSQRQPDKFRRAAFGIRAVRARSSTPRRIRRSSLTPSPASAFPPTASNRPWSKRWTG